MVRYPRLGGRRATGKILDDAILRRLCSYLASCDESAKFRCGPRNSAIDRETSLRPVCAGIDSQWKGCHFFPVAAALPCQDFREIGGWPHRDLPAVFPLLPTASRHPYTRRCSCLIVRTSPETGSGRDGVVSSGRNQSSDFSPHPVDRCVDRR